LAAQAMRRGVFAVVAAAGGARAAVSTTRETPSLLVALATRRALSSEATTPVRATVHEP
jgi:hypothetical protein